MLPGMARKSPSKPAPRKRFRPLRILIIDDDRAIAEVCEEFLLGNGFKVLLAHDGKIGLASARRGLPDLILLNQEMPRMTGLEVLRELREDPKTRAIKVIMNSVDAAYQTEAWAAGAEDFFQLPVTMEVLLYKVHKALGRPS